MSGCHLEDIENGTFKAMQNLTELWVNFFLDIIIDFSDVRAIVIRDMYREKSGLKVICT